MERLGDPLHRGPAVQPPLAALSARKERAGQAGLRGQRTQTHTLPDARRTHPSADHRCVVSHDTHPVSPNAAPCRRQPPGVPGGITLRRRCAPSPYPDDQRLTLSQVGPACRTTAPNDSAIVRHWSREFDEAKGYTFEPAQGYRC